MFARRVMLAALALATLAAPGMAAANPAAPICPWLGERSASPDTRAREVLAQMTLPENLNMVREPAGYTVPFGAAGWIPPDPRLCIPELVMNNAGAGVGDIHADTTAFPAPIAQAASWDPALERRIGAAIGQEAWEKGADVLLGPGIEIDRTPLDGRNFEYFSEDPFLAGQTAVAEVRGVQSQHVIATVKHFIANSQETNRNSVSADVDRRTLEEIYAPAYEAAVRQGGAGAVMCSYNRVNGTYSCESPDTLSELLKGQFGFPGFVMSDWGAAQSTVAAANAGLDMEMNNTPGIYYGPALALAIEQGQVPMSRLDDMVERILRSMFAIGVFDHPPAAQPAAFARPVSTPGHRALAEAVAEQGAVLLKNTGALPYAGHGQTIAVIGDAAGPFAEFTYGGGGSSHVPLPAYQPVKTPLQAITQRALRNGDRVVWTNGWATSDAVALAKQADVVFVFANDGETEGTDRSDLDLHYGSCNVFCAQSGDPNSMISAVAAANPNTVVVLETGGPVVMPWLDQVRAVLEAWYPGAKAADAITALLFGDAEPAGRLPETFPVSLADTPTNTSQQYPGTSDANGIPHAVYSEGLRIGYRWYDQQNIAPLFPFGYGLSYTTFNFSNLAVTADGAGGYRVSVSVTNTGSRRGAAVPELYLGLPSASGAPEPPQRLAGAGKLWLDPGQTGQVSIPLNQRSFSYWNTASRGWAIAPGCDTVTVGASSRDPQALHASIAQGGASC